MLTFQYSSSSWTGASETNWWFTDCAVANITKQDRSKLVQLVRLERSASQCGVIKLGVNLNLWQEAHSDSNSYHYCELLLEWQTAVKIPFGIPRLVRWYDRLPDRVLFNCLRMRCWCSIGSRMLNHVAGTQKFDDHKRWTRLWQTRKYHLSDSDERSGHSRTGSKDYWTCSGWMQSWCWLFFE